jgi:hypothetical protein
LTASPDTIAARALFKEHFEFRAEFVMFMVTNNLPVIDGGGSIMLPDEQRIWAYPVVGVPSAETLNDIAEKAQRSDQPGTPVLVYDHIGIRDAWAAHLQWLDDHIAAVRSIKVSEAAWSLSGWED